MLRTVQGQVLYLASGYRLPATTYHMLDPIILLVLLAATPAPAGMLLIPSLIRSRRVRSGAPAGGQPPRLQQCGLSLHHVAGGALGAHPSVDDILGATCHGLALVQRALIGLAVVEAVVENERGVSVAAGEAEVGRQGWRGRGGEGGVDGQGWTGRGGEGGVEG